MQGKRALSSLRPPERSLRRQSSVWNDIWNAFFSTNSFSIRSRCGVMNASTARSIGERWAWALGALVVRLDEFRLPPADDRRDRDLAGELVDPEHRLLGHELRLHFPELLAELGTRVGLAAQTSAAYRPRPSARYTRGSANSGNTVFSISSSVRTSRPDGAWLLRTPPGSAGCCSADTDWTCRGSDSC